MFPLSLKKNIRELDRQISLLETECENLESDKKEAKASSRGMIAELPNKPFVTGPCASASTYSSRLMVLSSTAPKIYSASCAHFRTMSEKSRTPDLQSKCGFNHTKFLRKSEKLTNFQGESTKEFSPPRFNHEQKTVTNSEENESETQRANLSKRDLRKSYKRSISSIKEVSESSDENTFLRDSVYDSKPKKNLIETSEEQTSDLLQEKTETEELHKNKKNTPRNEKVEQNQFKLKSSSVIDDERNKNAHSDEGETKFSSEKWPNEFERPLTPRRKVLNKRRLRSVRTKKNQHNEIVLDVNITKVLQEKETQCMLGSEEKDKAEAFTNLCDSLRSLYVLTAETQNKSSREKINDVLNDMKNSLMKISKINLINPDQNTQNMLASLKGNTMKPVEGEEVSHLKKTLYGVTKFCQELAGEKSALTEELLSKTRTVANLKSKEKEYLSMISNLKFNLKKLKQEAEDKAFVMRDLEILKTKLQEETKVIEALRKSHEKMQELVENYVLENDKLKTKVKISKLESEKYHVLLAGKEEEIQKYKKDIESFQRQITEQLSLLRSKATENEVVNALKAISDQTNSLQTEIDSNPSETTVEKENFKTIVLKSIETTSMSSVESKNKKQPPECFKREETPKKSTSSRESPKEEKIPKENATCPTCKAMDSDSETNSGTRRGLQRVLSSSKNLRSSINELLEDIRRETSEKHWSNAPCETTSLSTLVSSSSDDVSEKSDGSIKLQ